MPKAWQAMSHNVLPTLLEEGLGASDFRVLEVLLHKGPMAVNGIGPKVDRTYLQRARRAASQIRSRRVVVNGVTNDPQALWEGFKYSGLGREYGRYGIEAFLVTRAILDS